MKKVKFKDLGLLIVDEEQRFGVKQKEKIKRISKNIDVLSLSATPIPRTLHMSLVGARDMSVIETPPQERFPVQTYVIENNDMIIKDAIKREVRRGGQVYFIYNRVETFTTFKHKFIICFLFIGVIFICIVFCFGTNFNRLSNCFFAKSIFSGSIFGALSKHISTKAGFSIIDFIFNLRA